VALVTVALAGACKADPPALGGATASSGAGATGGGGATTGAGGGGGGHVDLPNDCDTYCDTIIKVCTSGEPPAPANAQYHSDDDCKDVCNKLPAGDRGQTSSNTVGCRVYYLGFVTDDKDPDAALHCRYAGPHGGDKCGGSCESFCFLAQKFCTGPHEEWPDEQACQKACNKWKDDVPFHVSAEGDNFACRLSHLLLAADHPSLYCKLAGEEAPKCIDPPNEGGGGMGGGLGGGGLGPGGGGGAGGGKGGAGGAGPGGSGGMMPGTGGAK
jgi:hypothetical protein